MKKLTIKYWNTLERGSKERALSMVFGNQHGIINMLLSEKPNKTSPFWKIVFNKVRIAKDGKRTMKSLGISVNPAFGDFGKNQPKNNCPNRNLIKQLILKTEIILTISCLIHTKSLILHKHLQEYGIYQRISQSMDRENSPINCFLEQAACIVRRSKIATGTLEPTESYKRGQIEELISFAYSNNLWINLNNYPVIYLDKGGENEVFYDGAATIYKLNNFEYAGDDLENFFIRIFAHNRFFNNIPYSLIGFSYNSKNEFCAVLTQPYIKAEREATEDEIAEHMQALGFEMDYYDEFHNEEYEIFDAVPNNVLYGIDGALYFIDTQIRLREEW